MRLGGQITVAAWTIAILILTAYHSVVSAAGGTSQSTALRALMAASSGPVETVRGASGYLTHLRLPVSSISPEINSLPPEARARNFFSDYRELFLAANTPLALSTVRLSPVEAGGIHHVRFQQSFKGVPVRGGEAIVHLNTAGVTSVESRLLADLSGLDMAPRITAIEARAAAHDAVNTRQKNTGAKFSVPRLEIINVEHVRGKQFGESRLAWLVEATGGPDKSIWVDAHSGRVILQVSRIAHAMARDVEDYVGPCPTDGSGVYVGYIEGGNVPTAGEALSAWNNAKIIYDYFFTAFGRDGLDGIGNSTTGRGTYVVNVCSSDLVRPPGRPPQDENTAWDRIAQWDRSVPDTMKFGTGMAAADDVVAHEYTHALAAYLMQVLDSNNINQPYGFMLAGQPGALAEAFADIFGQIVDLSANPDTSGTRWDIGEAAAGGPFRNLMNPNARGQPGKVTDALYYCGADDDIAIHTNSGVLSHAFALVVDGGTYNGVTVAGIGLDKAARVFYKALAERMLPASSFNDAYNALLTAADELVAAGTLPDRTSIQNALSAVELQITPCSFGTRNYCPVGQTKTDLFIDGFENPASGQWANSVISGVNHWNLGADASGISRPNVADASIVFDLNANGISTNVLGGNYALWADNTRSAGGSNLRIGDSVVTMANAINVPDQGDVHLQFEHKFDFETTNDTANIEGEPDGAVIEYSIDGGTVWTEAKELFREGLGYRNFIQADQDNPLAGRWAFTGSTNGEYASTQLSLTALAGQSVKFRFRMGTDKFSDRLGWMIDNVDIYTCQVSIADAPSEGRKRKGGAWDLFSILVMLGFIGATRLRCHVRKPKARVNSARSILQEAIRTNRRL